MNEDKKEEKVKPVKKTKGEGLKSPKGMRDLIGQEYYSYQGFFEKAAEIALYYGFQPIETPMLEKQELFTGGVGEFTDIVKKEMYTLKTKGGDKLALRPEGTAAIMRAYIEHGMQSLPQPLLFYYGGPFFRHENTQRGRYREFRQFGIEVLGSEKSIIDALVVRVVLTILEEAGVEKYVLKINSLGDKECRVEYRKALVAYYRKHTAKMTIDQKELIKTNPLRLLDAKDPHLVELREGAPAAMDFLLGPSKQHFKEVLEYLESMGIVYTIDNNLVRGLDYYSRTVFEIFEEKEEGSEEEPLALAAGGRYDYLARSLGMRKEVCGVGAAIGVDRLIARKDAKELVPRILKKPRVYFIQLGFEAKLHSLSIIDELRKAKIAIAQSLSKDKLAAQLATVERMRIPWVILLGQKEVLDGTVMVRNMKDHSQVSVKQEDLVTYIKEKIAR